MLGFLGPGAARAGLGSIRSSVAVVLMLIVKQLPLCAFFLFDVLGLPGLGGFGICVFCLGVVDVNEDDCAGVGADAGVGAGAGAGTTDAPAEESAGEQGGDAGAAAPSGSEDDDI